MDSEDPSTQADQSLLGAHLFSYAAAQILTHLCQVDSSTLMLWTGSFPVKGCLVSFYYSHVLQKFLYLKQTV